MTKTLKFISFVLLVGMTNANAIPEKYALTYSDAGGNIELRMFEGMHHNFAREPLPESHQAIEMNKNFISENIA